MENNVIYGINGPVVTVKDADCFEMMEMVHVGEQNLVGEVIGITSDFTTIQVYEETTGLKPGDVVTGTGAPMNVLHRELLIIFLTELSVLLRLLRNRQALSLTEVHLFLLLMTKSSGMLQ